MRIVLAASAAAVAVATGCGLVSGIDQLENVAGVASDVEAGPEASTLPHDAGVEGGAACAALFCDDFEEDDSLEANRVAVSFVAGAIDSNEHVSGSHSARFSVESGGAYRESGIIPHIPPIPIDGVVVIAFSYKRPDSNSTAFARFDVGVEQLQGFSGPSRFVQQSGSDLPSGPKVDTSQDPAPVGVWSLFELSLSREGPGSGPGRVQATLALRIDGVTAATLSGLDIADTITDVVMGDFGQGIYSTSVWLDDVKVSKN
jgi:hypothetical protein